MPNSFVRKLQAYAPLSERDVALLGEATGYERQVAAHRDLISEGDKPGPAFVVLAGWAFRYKILPGGSRQILAFMMPGDFCDPHIGTLEEMDHSLAAMTDCQIASIPRERMESLITATPALTRAFWRAQLIDEGISRAWIASMGRRNAIERVAHLMLELSVRMRNIGLATDETCSLPMTQTVLADALGLTPVHVNRVLRALRESEAMRLDRGKLTVLNVIKLAKIAGFDENYLHRRINIPA